MVLEPLFLIRVKNIDLSTGLNLLGFISNRFIIKQIIIKRSTRNLPRGALIREPKPKVWEGVYA